MGGRQMEHASAADLNYLFNSSFGSFLVMTAQDGGAGFKRALYLAKQHANMSATNLTKRCRSRLTRGQQQQNRCRIDQQSLIGKLCR
jgi:hypothetical protein